MHETACVTAITQDNEVTVTCSSQACEHCHAGGLCSAKGRTFPASNTHGLVLAPGDEVEIFLPPGKTIWATFITLLFPLLLFPVGYYLPLVMASNPTELVRALCGLALLGFGMLCTKLFAKRHHAAYLPEIIRKTRGTGMQDE